MMNYFTYYKKLLNEGNPREPGPVGASFTKFQTLLYWVKTPGLSKIVLLAPVFTNSNDNQKNRTLALPNQQKVKFWTFAERAISKEISSDDNAKENYIDSIIKVLNQRKSIIDVCIMPYATKLISDMTILGNSLKRIYSFYNSKTAKGIPNLNFLFFVKNNTSVDSLLGMIGFEKLESKNSLEKSNNTKKTNPNTLEEIKKEIFSKIEPPSTVIDMINSQNDLNTFLGGLSKYFGGTDLETLLLDLFCSKLPIIKVNTEEKETIDLNELDPVETEESSKSTRITKKKRFK